MIYTTDEKQVMDTILGAFRSYIQEQDYFDIIYSEKMGYLRILVNSPEEGAIILDAPEKMLEYLCGDVISDIVYSRDNPKKSHNDLVLTEYEKEESYRRLAVIFGAMGNNKEDCLKLVRKYIAAYQGSADGI